MTTSVETIGAIWIPKLAADSLKEGFVNVRSRVQIVPMASLVANDRRTQKRSS